MTHPLTETIDTKTLESGEKGVLLVIRSGYRAEVEAKIARHMDKVERDGGLLNFDGPKLVGGVWTAIGTGPLHLKPNEIECGDEHGAFEIENAPETYLEEKL